MHPLPILGEGYRVIERKDARRVRVKIQYPLAFRGRGDQSEFVGLENSLIVISLWSLVEIRE